MHLVKIKNKILKFNKILSIEGDKSLSIRWALIASQSESKSRSFNLLLSEDVINTLKCLRKLGVKVRITKKFCEINGVGLNGFKYKKKLNFRCRKFRYFGKTYYGPFNSLKKYDQIKR